jgi:hypothetical protein
VQKRFIMPTARNALEDWKAMHQVTSFREYFEQYEKLRTQLVLEGRQFSNTDYIDAFVCGLKGEVKPFVKMFKPTAVEEAVEYALYVEEANDNQFKQFKIVPMSPFSAPSLSAKNSIEKSPTSMIKQPQPMLNRTLIEQCRALGQCFKCDDKYFSGHWCKVKVQMIIGHEEEVSMPDEDELVIPTATEVINAEEAIVSMQATTSNPKASTMKFKGFIGNTLDRMMLTFSIFLSPKMSDTIVEPVG